MLSSDKEWGIVIKKLAHNDWKDVCWESQELTCSTSIIQK